MPTNKPTHGESEERDESIAPTRGNRSDLEDPKQSSDQDDDELASLDMDDDLDDLDDEDLDEDEASELEEEAHKDAGFDAGAKAQPR